MPNKKIFQLFAELSFSKKLMIISSAVMIVSLVMPWYSDMDSFKTGDVFLGITGPAYLVGISLLGMSVANIALVILEKSGRKYAFSDVKSSTFYMITGIISFYLLIVVNAFYFHPKFGVNITVKQSGFGMFFAFLAASGITVGGYLSGRNRKENQ